MSIIFITNLTTTTFADEAATITFKDVNSKHWADSAITWAAKEGVAKGDGTGNFRPNVQITEAEFLAMLVRTFKMDPEPWDDMSHWADPLYEMVVQLNWPVKGYMNNNERAKVLNRTRVAEIVSAADGVNFSGDDAIRYMLKQGYSNGITSATVAGYQGSKSLTRAEAVTFIKNLLNKGMTELKERPTDKTPSTEVGGVGNNVNNATQKVVEAANKFISGKKEFSDVQIQAPSDNVVGLVAVDVSKHDYPTKLVLLMEDGQASKGIRLYQSQNDSYIGLAAEMLKAAGVPVDANFTKTVIKYRDSQKEVEVKYGKYTVAIVPDRFDMNLMYIYYF